MSDPKPFASLGATLLARKGNAKPAMRPQSSRVSPLANQATAQNLEDLGWDDMGDEDAAANHSAEVLNLTPSPHNPEAEAMTDKASPRPTVRSMHEELALRLAEEQARTTPADTKKVAPAASKKQVVSLPDHAEGDAIGDRPGQKQDDKPIAHLVAAKSDSARTKPQAANDSRRAAFTLRLDAKRHLKLRLASTVRNRSAQQLVTEALDRFLEDIPELDTLVAQVERDR